MIFLIFYNLSRNFSCTHNLSCISDYTVIFVEDFPELL